MTDSNSTPETWEIKQFNEGGSGEVTCLVINGTPTVTLGYGKPLPHESARYATIAAATQMAALLRELVSGFDQAVTAAEIRAGGRQSDGVRAVAGRRVVMAAITAARPILAVIDGGQ